MIDLFILTFRIVFLSYMREQKPLVCLLIHIIVIYHFKWYRSFIMLIMIPPLPEIILKQVRQTYITYRKLILVDKGPYQPVIKVVG